MKKKFLALNKIAGIANQLQINLWLYGSFAVEILTNKSINPNADIDITCSKVSAYKLLLKKSIQEHHYKLINESCWEAGNFGKAYNAKITSPDGVEIDISFIKGEIALTYKKTLLPNFNNKNIFIFTAPDLLRMYKQFGKRNPSQNKQKINLLKSLIQLERTSVISD